MPNAWIFQATPNRFLIDEYLATKPTESAWLARQHHSDMEIGDVIFVWRAQGKRRARRGIVAKATITRLPEVRKDHPSALPFWVGARDRGQADRRVGITYARVTGFIPREAFLSDPVLRHVSI
ncbi:MAG TPA: EVE domain-containing protein, partial [Bauldia sp.]|nr:EVE domain-containing protein [Bauldia sp.]